MSQYYINKFWKSPYHSKLLKDYSILSIIKHTLIFKILNPIVWLHDLWKRIERWIKAYKTRLSIS